MVPSPDKFSGYPHEGELSAAGMYGLRKVQSWNLYRNRGIETMSTTFTYMHPKAGMVQHKLKTAEWTLTDGVMSITGVDSKERRLSITTNCAFVLRSEEGTTGLPTVDAEEEG